MGCISSGWNRYLDTNQTADMAAPSIVSATAPARLIPIFGAKVVRIWLFGAGSNNNTLINTAFWLIDTDTDTGVDATTYFASRFCSIATTTLSSSLTGVEGSALITSTDLLADTMTTAVLAQAANTDSTGPGSSLTQAYEGSGDANPAELIIQGRVASQFLYIQLLPTTTSTATNGNALWKVDY